MQPESSEVTFASLPLAAPLQRALADKGYTHPSPIQARAIPPVAAGRDLIGIAQTGTGKTAAFSLPILNHLIKSNAPRVPGAPRVLILTPTRELAAQIAENIAQYGAHVPVKHTVIFGGVGERPQIEALRRGVDIVIATPGRLEDLLNQRHVALDRVEVFVLDEADRMLDMGFAPVVKRLIAKLPRRRQSLLFSATMPESIRELANSLLHDPVRVEVTPSASTADRVDQLLCHVATKANKHLLLLHHLQQYHTGLILVFSRTKHGADKIVRALEKDGVKSHAIHGNKSQGARTRALESFRSGKSRVLVATDIASRGIDVKGVELVINYDLPDEPEAYVHRIGRTARAGAEGQSIAYCCPEELSVLRDVQRTIRQTITVCTDHPFQPSGGTPSLNGPLPLSPMQNGSRSQQNNQRAGNRGGGARSGGNNHGPRSGPSHGHGGGTATAAPRPSRLTRTRSRSR